MEPRSAYARATRRVQAKSRCGLAFGQPHYQWAASPVVGLVLPGALATRSGGRRWPPGCGGARRPSLSQILACPGDKSRSELSRVSLSPGTRQGTLVPTRARDARPRLRGGRACRGRPGSSAKAERWPPGRAIAVWPSARLTGLPAAGFRSVAEGDAPAPGYVRTRVLGGGQPHGARRPSPHPARGPRDHPSSDPVA